MPASSTTMNPVERKAVVSLALIFALRMLGLFIILPVIAIAVRDIPEATPTLVGLAIGMYGLTQAMCQIPFGFWSDRYGRKKVITVGLLIFAVGSVVAAMSDNIYLIIMGRALQGAGAVAAAILALVADLTREQQRIKAMAMIGGSIGLSFMAALILGPILYEHVGLSGIFLITGALALGVLPVLWWWTPNPKVSSRSKGLKFNKENARNLLGNRSLFGFYIGIFILHFSLTAFFVVVPLELVDQLQWGLADHWKLYVPILVMSVVGMVPVLVLAHKWQKHRLALAVGIFLMMAAQIVFAVPEEHIMSVVVGLWLYFCGFNALEAMLPSLVSRLAPAGARGTVMGIYNTFEFTGIFLGGLCSGVVYSVYGALGVYTLSLGVLGVWLVVILLMKPLKLLHSLTVKLAPNFSETKIFAQLQSLDGVEDSTLFPDEGLGYIKVNEKIFKRQSIESVRGVELL